MVNPIPRTLVLCILVVALLAVVPPGEAQLQVVDQEVEEIGVGSLVLPDPQDDVSPFAVVPVGTPLGTVYQHLDILDITIDRDRTNSLDVAFRFQGRDAVMTTAAEAAALSDWRCSFRFILNDQSDLRYTVNVRPLQTIVPNGGAAPGEIYASLSVSDWRDVGYGGGGSYDEAVDVVWDDTLPGFVTTIDKSFLEAGPSQGPPAKGDRMTRISASCYADVVIYGNMNDALWASDSEFWFVDPGPGQVVSVAFDDPESALEEFQPASGRTVAFSPGTPTAVPFRLENNVTTKKIVTLTPSVVDAEGNEQPWNLTMVPTLELKAGASRAVKLVAVPPSDVPFDRELSLRVDLAVLGENAPGRAERQIDLVPVLSSEHDTYRFHAQSYNGIDGSRGDGGPGGHAVTFHSFMLSLHDELEGYDDEPVRLIPTAGRGSSFTLAPLPQTVRLDPDDVFRLTLEFEADGATNVDYRFTLNDPMNGDLFSVRDNVPADGPIVVERLPAEDAVLEIGAGTALQGRFAFYDDPFEGEGPATELRFDPKASSFRLPVTDVVEEEVVVTDGRFLPSLTLAGDEDRDNYLNPGKATTWKMVLANDGVETDDLTVTLDMGNATREGWSASVEPGMTYRVPAGNATPLGVTLRAPDDAAEGDVVNVTVKAVSKHDADASTTIKLRAIVTSGVEIEDEEYEAGDGQLAPLTEAEESPGAGLLSVAAVALLAGLLRRRR